MVSVSHMAMKISRRKNADTGVTSVRSAAGVFLRNEIMTHPVLVWKIGIPDPFTFHIIYPNYAQTGDSTAPEDIYGIDKWSTNFEVKNFLTVSRILLLKQNRLRAGG